MNPKFRVSSKNKAKGKLLNFHLSRLELNILPLNRFGDLNRLGQNFFQKLVSTNLGQQDRCHARRSYIKMKILKNRSSTSEKYSPSWYSVCIRFGVIRCSTLRSFRNALKQHFWLTERLKTVRN